MLKIGGVMKKLPKTINVFGVEYEIIITNEISNLGEIDVNNRTIKLHSYQQPREMLATLLHELGHATFRRCGFSQGIPEPMEEAIVEAMANMIVELFDLEFRVEKITKKKTKS